MVQFLNPSIIKKLSEGIRRFHICRRLHYIDSNDHMCLVLQFLKKRSFSQYCPNTKQAPAFMWQHDPRTLSILPSLLFALSANLFSGSGSGSGSRSSYGTCHTNKASSASRYPSTLQNSWSLTRYFPTSWSVRRS